MTTALSTTMFRCSRPRPKLPSQALCLPSVASTGSGSRGLKLSKLPSASVLSQVPRGTFIHGTLTTQGRTFMAQLLEHDIGLHSELKIVKHLDWRGVSVKLAPRHTVQSHDIRYFSESGSGYAEAVARRYLDHHAERPLWFNVIGASAKAKAIVRGKAAARLNGALKQALRNCGYDAHGWRLSDDAMRKHGEVLGAGKLQDPARLGIAQLFGAIEILAREPTQVIDVSFVELRIYCMRIVKTLEEQCGRTADGRRLDLGRRGPSQGSGSRPQKKAQGAHSGPKKQR